jgi:hypothetical protein
MLESKGGKRIFPVVSVIWQSPLIHVVTPTKGIVTSQVTKMRRSLRVSVHHLRHGGAQTIYKVTKTSFVLPQHHGKLRRSPRSPRSPRYCQSPRVTSLGPHLSRIQSPRMDAQSYSSSIPWPLLDS